MRERERKSVCVTTNCTHQAGNRLVPKSQPKRLTLSQVNLGGESPSQGLVELFPQGVDFWFGSEESVHISNELGRPKCIHPVIALSLKN